MALSPPGCADPAGYSIKQEKIYFHGNDGDGFVQGADPKTFKSYNDFYGRDATHVFVDGELLRGADPDTFKLVGDVHGRDEHSCYAGIYRYDVCDPATFHDYPPSDLGLENWYADSQRVYFKMHIVSGADPRTFQVITPEYGKDANHVFSMWYLIPGADPATFKRTCGISMATGADKDRCYANWRTVPCGCR